MELLLIGYPEPRETWLLPAPPCPKGAITRISVHAQQAAEKAIKAVHLHQQMDFRYTHDLDALLTGLLQQGMVIPQEVQASVFLTLFAWETRYPGLGPSVSLDEYQDAVRHAEIVVSWAEQVLGS
ncbi:MAG: HEPN domain-containing protein [Magnetococcales bacterium]|nr:HEPN domain-containing protein [Magnetococcales bacterium]